MEHTASHVQRQITATPMEKQDIPERNTATTSTEVQGTAGFIDRERESEKEKEEGEGGIVNKTILKSRKFAV